jgi:hypothetical protein
MTRGISGFLAALAIVIAFTQCTGGQSGHEGGGLDGPGNGPDGGQVGGSGGKSPTDHGNAGAGGTPDDTRDGGCVQVTGGVLGDRTTDQDGGADSSTDGGVVMCPVDDPDEDGGTPRNRTPLDSAHVCGASAVQAPIDCFDVCGALVTCDAAIECDACLERCNDSRQVTGHGVRCLSLAIYWIDEEGCERMVHEYEAYTEEFDCGP